MRKLSNRPKLSYWSMFSFCWWKHKIKISNILLMENASMAPWWKAVLLSEKLLGGDEILCGKTIGMLRLTGTEFLFKIAKCSLQMLPNTFRKYIKPGFQFYSRGSTWRSLNSAFTVIVIIWALCFFKPQVLIKHIPGWSDFLIPFKSRFIHYAFL